MWNASEGENSVTFSMDCPDNDQGYPGTFKVSCEYKLSDENEIILTYTALSDKDTVANITNHSYFNLNGNGSGSVDDHIFWVNSDKYTPFT